MQRVTILILTTMFCAGPVLAQQEGPWITMFDGTSLKGWKASENPVPTETIFDNDRLSFYGWADNAYHQHDNNDTQTFYPGNSHFLCLLLIS